MRPFNLEEAIQGKPLVTRDGRKILDFHYFEPISKSNRYPIQAITDGCNVLKGFTLDGKYKYNTEESNNDLFMYEEPKTYYVNVYRYSDEMILTSNGILSKEATIKNGGNNKNYIKTIEITI